GTPTMRQLVASGSTLQGTKAVAIFPNFSNTAAPNQELFIVENRFRVGNDAGPTRNPGDGLLIWHVDARPNAVNNDFLEDNSFSSIKLIRLMRADNGNDFGASEQATSATYFRSPKDFTPSSSPTTSNTNDGTLTGVVVKDISP